MKPIRFSLQSGMLAVLVGCAAEQSVTGPPDHSPVAGKAPAGLTVAATEPSQAEH